MIELKLLRPLMACANTSRRFFSGEAKKKFKVAVIGAAGGIGQPLSLLLKMNPTISELRLHDMNHTPGTEKVDCNPTDLGADSWKKGVAADLSHIETATKVSQTTSKDMGCAMAGGVDVIVVAAGIARKPGMTRADLLKSNAQVAYDLGNAMAKQSPDAILILITNPVNTLVPIVCETLKSAGKLNAKKIFGCSTLDSVRANTFIGELTCTDPKNVNVPIVGGHSGPTIVPLISRSNPPACVEGEKLDALIKRIQEAGTEVVKAKAGKGSATLSMAYAASRLTYSILRALGGESNIVECAYVQSDVYPGVKYLATPLLLGKCGIEKNLGLGKMNECEQKLFCDAVKTLQKDIKAGEDFVKEQQKNKCK